MRSLKDSLMRRFLFDAGNLSLSLSLSPSVCPLDPLPSTGKSNLRIAQLSRETWSHARQEEFFQQEDQKSQRMQCPVQL